MSVIRTSVVGGWILGLAVAGVPLAWAQEAAPAAPAADAAAPAAPAADAAAPAAPAADAAAPAAPAAPADAAPAAPALAAAQPAPVVDSGSPKPAMVPKSWELKFDFDDLQRISVRVPGEATPRTYWYMLYTVVNNTGRDVNFFPEFQVVTDKLQIIPAELAVPPAVFEAIKARHAQQYPHLVAPVKAIGRLLQGEDNGVDSVAVFPQIPLDDNNIKVFVGGLSGETLRVRNPAWAPDSPKDVPEAFVLTKTLSIQYRLPGDPKFRDQANPVRLRREWVMR